jgi:hypothetical protein
MDYLLWNDRIAAHFFNPEMKGRRVYLHITDELIQELGNPEGSGVLDFVNAAKSGPPWCTAQPLCVRAEEAFVAWRRRKRPFPPYLGLLALFVLAAGSGDDREFAAQAYYPRLRKLLGEDQDGKPYPYFSEMRALWRDLEVWSRGDMNGSLGVFEFPATGRFVHVGVPISQVILSAEERRHLPFIFVEAALDAGTAPAESYLDGILAQFGPQWLRSRTIRILEDPAGNREEHEALIEAVLEELRSWDGRVTQITESGARKTSTHGALRLCCDEVDFVSKTVTLRLRCRIRHEFPEDDLLLSPLGTPVRYRCQEYSGGWSTVLEHTETHEPLDGSEFDIFADLAMRELESGWRFKLPRADVRVFSSGAAEGLSGYVEVQQMPTEAHFLLIANASAWHLIERWGQASCRGFMHLKDFWGLPPGCRLYKVDRAINDNIVRSVYPALAFPSSDRIRLEGGIRVSGNAYFGFALPRIVVESSDPNFKVFCNGKVLTSSHDGEFVLPSRAQDGTTLEIEVKKEEKLLASKSIFVYSRFHWQNLEALAWFDALGARTHVDDTPRAAGAKVEGNPTPIFEDWITLKPTVVEETIFLAPDQPADSRKNEVPSNYQAESIPGLCGLIHEWRDELESGQVFTSASSELASRVGGDLLTEGAIHYRAAVANNSAKSFNRAIRIFSDLAEGTVDQVVQVVARALQQLAFYRSGRHNKATVVDLSCFPVGFSRLESAMRGLAELCGAPNDTSTWPEGLSFSDLSPVQADRMLDEEIRKNILAKCVTI